MIIKIYNLDYISLAQRDSILRFCKESSQKVKCDCFDGFDVFYFHSFLELVNFAKVIAQISYD